MNKNRFIIVIILLCSINAFSLAKKHNNQNFEQRFTSQGLVNVKKIIPSIKVDLKYSSTDNFLGEDVYGDLNKAYLYKEAAIKLKKAQSILKKQYNKYSLIIYDAARPRSVQRKMWNIVRGTSKQRYVANPKSGSIHNYGCAVDVSIVDENGNELDMGTPFDYFGDLAQPRYEKKYLKEGRLTHRQIENRKLLRKTMVGAGFIPVSVEWWHFNAFDKNYVKTHFKPIE